MIMSNYILFRMYYKNKHNSSIGQSLLLTLAQAQYPIMVESQCIVVW